MSSPDTNHTSPCYFHTPMDSTNEKISQFNTKISNSSALINCEQNLPNEILTISNKHHEKSKRKKSTQFLKKSTKAIQKVTKQLTKNKILSENLEKVLDEIKRLSSQNVAKNIKKKIPLFPLYFYFFHFWIEKK